MNTKEYFVRGTIKVDPNLTWLKGKDIWFSELVEMMNPSRRLAKWRLFMTNTITDPIVINSGPSTKHQGKVGAYIHPGTNRFIGAWMKDQPTLPCLIRCETPKGLSSLDGFTANKNFFNQSLPKWNPLDWKSAAIDTWTRDFRGSAIMHHNGKPYMISGFGEDHTKIVYEFDTSDFSHPLDAVKDFLKKVPKLQY